MSYFVYITLVLSMIIVTKLSHVNAECCGHGHCGTGYGGVGNWCCGCGSCNFFCCNCDNGCNRGYEWYYLYNIHVTCGHKKRRIFTRLLSNISLEAEMLFRNIDINGNNAINMEEADAYANTRFKRSSSFSLGNELRIMDTNNDGIISPDEFDESLKM